MTNAATRTPSDIAHRERVDDRYDLIVIIDRSEDILSYRPGDEAIHMQVKLLECGTGKRRDVATVTRSTRFGSNVQTTDVNWSAWGATDAATGLAFVIALRYACARAKDLDTHADLNRSALADAYDAGYAAALAGTAYEANPHAAPVPATDLARTRTRDIKHAHDAWARGHGNALADEADEAARLDRLTP